MKLYTAAMFRKKVEHFCMPREQAIACAKNTKDSRFFNRYAEHSLILLKNIPKKFILYMLSYKLNRFIKLYDEYIPLMLKAKDRKNLTTQVCEIIKLMCVTKYWPQNYFKFRGYKKNIGINDIASYVPGKLFDDLRNDFLNNKNYNILVEDKFIFNKYLTASGIRSTSALGVYWPGQGVNDLTGEWVKLSDFINDLEHSFVVKPVSGAAQGQGVYIIDVNKTAGIKSYHVCGISYTLSELIKFLESNFPNTKLLIESKIKQHTEIAKLYPNSVNTVRIDTLLTLKGDVVFGNAFLRLGRNGRTVDNWSGIDCGIAVKIDMKVGALEEFGETYTSEVFTHHPNTSVSFKGYSIPYWDEIIELVHKLAKLFPEIRSIGWDVAITNTGPVIIEANSDYSLQLSQSCNSPYYKNREFISTLSEYVESRESLKKYKKYFSGKL